ncbi:AAA family ATPase [Gilvimarinus xylanilyticus]|uniref:AAA family ATPase n=1 Tax=Gilvimarinus xylanilyticus TaxID=2944139 RepID=A0A9X2I5J1_9GAMM|nr:AAA family ATPase [Gilvimarinus xylanilyticus]MCP8900740.1 AAA family ATPase [Gilvimarinus xylanilyticus]
MNDPNYFDALGLHKDPFGSGPAPDLWSGLEALSLEVLHTVEFVAPVAVVVGPSGTGKTSLATELAARLENSGDTLSLRAAKLNSENQLLGVIADFLDLPVDAGARAGELLVQIRSAMTEGQLYLLIDDADLLGDESLAPLMSLLQSSRELPPIRIVLLSARDISSRLDGYGMPDIAVQDFYIPFIELPEAAGLLQLRVEQAGYTGADPLFDESLVEPWWEEAEGNFNRLFGQAKMWLLEEALSAQEPASPSEKSAPRLPVVHVVAVAALIAGLGMVYLYSGDTEEEGANTGVDKPVEGGVSLQIPPQRKEVVGPGVKQSEPAGSVGPKTSGARNTLPQSAEGGGEDFVSTQTGEPLSREVETGDSFSADAVRHIDQNAEKSLTRTAKDATTEEGSNSSTQLSSVRAADELQSLSQPVATVEDSGLGAGGEAEAGGQVRPASASYEFDELEILSWPESDYTLQVLGVSSEASARNYIDVQANKSQLVLYTTERDGKPWFVVLAGRYASRADAKSAISGLPDRQQKASPWIRSVEAIHAAIR